MPAFDPKAAARFIADAHRQRAVYQNLPSEIAPSTVDEAYAAQEALRELWRPLYGELAGLKIATTTKVMQQLMGIDHPCGGMIYERRVHGSPASIRLGDYMHVVIECELAVRMGRTLAKKAQPYTREDVRAAVSVVMPAFELIEDRKAVYKESKALSLIADNAWNAGIVLGAPMSVGADKSLDGIKGKLAINGKDVREGLTDDPMGALAWLANLAADRNRPLQAGMVVITGSLIPTLPIAAGERLVFEIEGIGKAELSASA
jgi:2-keto-4-pentenoate hydratase